MEFKIKGTTVGLSIAKEHVAIMIKHISESNGNETGGILVGCYTEDGQHAVIYKVTGPPSDSQSGRNWFIRGVAGLADILKAAKEEGEYYLGEWHYHPNGDITPSPLDRKQMRKISRSKDYNCPEPIMIIIAGTAETYGLAPYLANRKNNELIKMSLSEE